MIGYIKGKFIGHEDGGIILVDVGGVGYSVLVSSRISSGFSPGKELELFIHTNLRENALELFGFSSSWEKKVFHALVSVSGVGPRTAISILSGLDPETVLTALIREDRATLGSVSGIGKKTAERLIIELGDKARKLLSERGTQVSPKKTRNAVDIPPQGASAIDLTDLWNEAVAALVNLGYREGDAVAAIKIVSNKAEQAGEDLPLEKLIMNSLQLMSRGLR